MKIKASLILTVMFTVLISSVTAFGYTTTEKYITREYFCHNMSEVLKEKGIFAYDLKENNFYDVDENNQYYNDIISLYSMGVIIGNGSGYFKPDEYIQYKDAATMLMRIVLTDEYVLNSGETYPAGYLKYASEYGIFEGVIAKIDNYVTPDHLSLLMENLKTQIKIYNIMKPLNCDDYNGRVYIDYYPKAWQGYESEPVSGTNGYFNILPASLHYSYDKINWHTAYEDINGVRVYYNLPDNISGVQYDWGKHVFTKYPFEEGNEGYSYDMKEWNKGILLSYVNSEIDITLNTLPYGIDKKSVLVYNKEADLYFATQAYEKEYYESEVYHTEFVRTKHNVLWVSKNLVNWVGINIPNEMVYFTGISQNTEAKAMMITGWTEFTEEEKLFLDNEEKKALALNKDYDKPIYKHTRYMLLFDDINKLFS